MIYEFLNSLTIEQMEMLQKTLEKQLVKKKSFSKKHILADLVTCSDEELEILKKQLTHQQFVVVRDTDYQQIKLHLSCIDIEQELRKN